MHRTLRSTGCKITRLTGLIAVHTPPVNAAAENT